MSNNITPVKKQYKIHNKSCLQTFVFQEITEKEVSSFINIMKSYSSQEIDEIPPKFVKVANSILSPVFTKLYNKCFHQESFPELFKMAYDIPISKNSSPKSFEELRPISLLPIFAKTV